MGGDRTLFDQLAEYAAGDMYPFHMPGHKRNMPQFEQLYRHDITEIDGFDSEFCAARRSGRRRCIGLPKHTFWSTERHRDYWRLSGHAAVRASGF